MNTYKVRNKVTGQTLTIRGSTPPSREYLDSISTNKTQSPTQAPKDTGSYKPGMGAGEYLTGMSKNMPKSAFENLKSIGSAILHPIQTAKSLWNVGSGAVQSLIPGEQGNEPYARQVGDMYKQRYGGVENIKKTLYEDPAGVGMDVATVAGGVSGVTRGVSKLAGVAGKADMAGSLNRVADIAGDVSRVADPLQQAAKLNPFKGVTKKAGQALDNFSDTYALKSTRIPTKQMSELDKKIGGLGVYENTKDLIEKTGLYGQNTDNIIEYIKPIQETLEEMQSGKLVGSEQVFNKFDEKIAALSTSEAMRNPALRNLKEFLENEREMFSKSIGEGSGMVYDQNSGNLSIADPIDSLVNTKKTIDANTPKGAFKEANLSEYNKMRNLGNVYREVVNDTAKTTEVGKQLASLYSFLEKVENAPNGKNTLPVGITNAVMTTAGAASGNTMLGKIASAVTLNALTKFLNNPTVIGKLSKLAKKASSATEFAPMFLKELYEFGRAGSRVEDKNPFKESNPVEKNPYRNSYNNTKSNKVSVEYRF